MEATLTIRMDNAAFSDDRGGEELARILRKLADQVEGDRFSGDGCNSDGHYPVMDINGNKVGALEIG